MVTTTHIQSVNIRPEVSILSILKSVNYKAWYAIAEFVDNAIQNALATYDDIARVEGDEYRLRVEIEIDGTEGHEKIVIRDNAGGIGIGEFPRAFRPASLPVDRSGLSEFGMGMKSAACWFADYWTVRTSAIGESTERTITFDVKRIVEQQIEDLPIQERRASPDKHYTELTLTKLNQLPQKKTVTKIKSHLASMYRVFLRDGFLELFYNGEPITFADPAILVAPYYKTPHGEAKEWRKPIEVEISPGMKITGFAGLLERGSTTNAGFALLRRHRVIVGSDDEGYRPVEIFGHSNSFIFQRLFGELHLEGFEVSHTKDGIQWNHHEENILHALKKTLNEQPLPLLEQAREYRARSNGTGGVKPTGGSTQPNISNPPSHPSPLPTSSPPSSGSQSSLSGVSGDQKYPPATHPPSAKPFGIAPPTPSKPQKRILKLKLNDEIWTISVELTDDPGVGEWLSFNWVNDEDREFNIRVARNHPFIATYCSDIDAAIEPLIRIAACISAAEIAARELGLKQVGTIRKVMNQLLRDGFAEE
jgi:hypothetical protein